MECTSKNSNRGTHNISDLMPWDQEVKICGIIKCSCLLDINIKRKVNERLENHGLLVRNLQIMHPKYKIQVPPIVIGTVGYVPKCLINYLKMIGFNKNKSKVLISKLEIKARNVKKKQQKFAKGFSILMTVFIILILLNFYLNLHFNF